MNQSKFNNENIPNLQNKKKFRWKYIFLLTPLVVIAGIGAMLSHTFSQINVETSQPVRAESDRLNILLLGYGGPGHDGPYLTDSLMLVSVQKSTGKVAMISIPRDLYVDMPGETQKQKINYAYSLGMKKNGAAEALNISKEAVAKVTDLNIDYAISIDHAAFKEIIDILGGIDINLDKPFIENQQWTNGGDYGRSKAFHIQTETVSTPDGIAKIQKWVFGLPAGTSHLDGITALYFSRARYSSTDFDRMARQQQVLSAIKDKAMTLGILTNPVKLIQLMDSLGKNIKMDMSAGDLTSLLSLYSKLDTKNITHKVFDTTPEGLLYQSKSDTGEYILSPIGDNFDKIKEVCKNIFQ